MKKLVFLLAVAFSAALYSCSGNKAEEATEAAVDTVAVVAAEAVEEVVDTVANDTTVVVEEVVEAAPAE